METHKNGCLGPTPVLEATINTYFVASKRIKMAIKLTCLNEDTEQWKIHCQMKMRQKSVS